MIFTVDDLCLEYLNNFKLFEDIKRDFPEFKLIAFTISNFKNNEHISISTTFKKWFERNKDWVEIAVHSYDHDDIPDGDRDNEEYFITKALEELKSFLPKEYGYRSPGWQTTNKTEEILKKLGFSYIAYESKIKNFKNKTLKNNIINSHLYDVESIKKIHEILRLNT
jgi:predicted deacetylase